MPNVAKKILEHLGQYSEITTNGTCTEHKKDNVFQSIFGSSLWDTNQAYFVWTQLLQP